MTPHGVVAGLLALAVLQQGQGERGVLRSADVRIAIADTVAVVEAEYTVVGAGTLNLLALRVKAQTIAVEQATMGVRELALEDREASVTLQAYRPPDSATIRVRYRLAGRLARIPLFVPSAPTNPPVGTVRITVTGLDATRAAVHTVPRFSREEGGAFVARLEHLPSLVALVADPAELPVPTIAELVVLAVAVGGTGFWMTRLARGRRKPVPER